MSIDDKLDTIGNSLTDIKGAILNKGVTPSGNITTYAAAINSIEAGGGTSRNIGEIVASTIPLTDAGLHLLDGSLIDGNGIYSDFVNYMVDLYVDNPTASYFCSESDWQSSVLNYGVCGKFVYDSVNSTIRLPKITGFVEGANGVASLGNLVEAGLPNITGNFNSWSWEGDSYNPVGAFYKGATGQFTYDTGAEYTGKLIGIDASRSSSIYGNSLTVQPQTVKVLYYIVVAETAKTNIQVDIDEIATDLNGKADVDLSNVNDAGSSKVAGWGMPSNIYIDLTVGASGSTYTATANGYVFVNATCSQGGWCYINSDYLETISQSYDNTTIANWIPIAKGEIFSLVYSNATIRSFKFIYAQGSESEAQ